MVNRTNVWALAALTAGALVLPAQAGDEVDRLLYRQANKLHDMIESKKAGAVGVLKFRAQKAAERETFNAGPINSIMAERLETVLIMVRESNSLTTKIVRDAGATVAKAGQRLNYLNPSDRPKMFEMSYKDVEKNTCTPDLFFTGVVKLDQKSHETTVVIEAFDRNANTIEEVARFTTPNERSTLNDFGQAYVLARRNLINRPDLDGTIDADKQSGFQGKGGLPVMRSPDKLADLKMYLNNTLVPFEDDPTAASPGTLKFTCREPLETDTVHFVIENTTPDTKVSCVLKVNGESTLFRERDAAQSCRKWILAPGKSIKVGGFYESEVGMNMRKFVVKSVPDSDEPLSPVMQGTIDFHVFIEDKQGPPVNDPEKMPVTRGLSRDLSSYRDLNKDLVRSTKLGSRGVILGGAAAQGNALQMHEFDNPKEQAHWFIRYMPKKD